MDWPRFEVNQHLRRANLSIITTRQTREAFAAVATDLVCGQHKIASVYDGSYVFPLYRYPSDKPVGNLFDDEEKTNAPDGRRPNLNPEFIKEFRDKLKMQWIADGKGDRQANFGPEDVFSYMYAVFHCPTYRSRYADLLKRDFPRLPLTSQPALFRKLCELGDELVALHLMDKSGPNLPSYPQEGDHLVEKAQYQEPKADEPGRVWINNTQYFQEVPPEVWNFHIGGYQVANKWLKDRKGRHLSYEDLTHYQKTIAALAETIRLMAEIDETIQEHGGWPMQ